MHKALFLDRDGVINQDLGYVGSIARFEFLDGIFELCRQAIQKGYLIFIITNQSGVERGHFSHKDYNELSNWMIEQFKEHDIIISKIYSCFTAPIKGEDPLAPIDPRRKPNPGMLLEAITAHNINPDRSIFIGDKETDMLAAKHANIPTRLLFSDTKEPEATENIQTLSEVFHFFY